MKLKNDDLMQVEGGAIKALAAILFGIGALAAFITGIIDGYLNPLKCN